MTKPEEMIRQIIAETVEPRLRHYADYVADARADALPVARADLLYLWDDYHQEHLDWATLGHPLGHNHPHLGAAVTDQLVHYGHTGRHHVQRWPVEYARRLSQCFTAPGEEQRQVLWTEGERDAVRWALRLAAGPGKRAAVLDTGWHDWLRPAPDIQVWSDPVPADAWPSVGAVLLATVDRQGQPVPTDRLRRLFDDAAAHRVPVIVDETVTGFGRTGPRWGHERSEARPDVVVLGGVVGGGYPLGAVIAGPRFFADTDLDTGGQAGNPVSCAAGAAALGVVDLGVPELVAETGPLLGRHLDDLVSQFCHVLSGRHGQGLLHGLRFHDPADAARLTLDCRAHGLYLAPPVGDTVLIAPALVTSTNEVSRGADLLAATLMSWSDPAT